MYNNTNSMQFAQQTGYQQPQQQAPGFMQPQSTGYFQQQQSQGPPLPLRNASTTTDFGDFQQNKPDFYGGNTTFIQQPQQTGFNQQQPQLQQTGFTQQQPQQTGFTQQPQQTGFTQQPQQTGFTQQQPQLQQTGFNQKPIQLQQTGFNSAPPATSFGGFTQPPVAALQPQQTGYYSSSQPIEPLKPNATGFVNSMVNSSEYNDTLSLPNRRISFVTLNDQQKFEKLFRSKVPKGSNSISGKNCRDILMKSGLPPKQLAQIWTLADTNKAGELLFPEFVLAMYLVNSVLHGESLPYDLEIKIRNEVTSFVDAINFMVGEEANEQQQTSAPPAIPTPFDNLTIGIGNLQPQPTGMMPSISFGNVPLSAAPPPPPAALTQQYTGGLQPQGTGFMPQTSFGQQMQAQLTGAPQTSFGFGMQQPQQSGALQPQQTGFGLRSQPTGFLPPSNFNPTAPLVAQKTGYGNNELYSQSNFASKFTAENDDYITAEEKALFYKIFDTYDNENSGLLDSPKAVEIFRKSGLNRSDLEHIWNLADADNSGKLNRQEFAVGMHLVYRKLNGFVLPNVLPRSLVPKSTQIIDLMKTQLKSNNDSYGFSNKAATRSNGSDFKNEDELPQFRSRRSESSGISQKQGQNNDSVAQNQDLQEIEQLKKLIRDKKILIDGELARNEDRELRNNSQKIEDLKEIENLKSQILSLPSLSSASSAKNDDSELKLRYEALQSSISSTFASIKSMEEAITNTKIQIYKKKNPSSIVGTGPNGEITDFDRKKAKRKALLAERMASLTGKPVTKVDDLEKEDQRLNEAIVSIQQESMRNIEVASEIKSTIDEIVAGISDLSKDKSDDPEYSKFELGVGLTPEVKSFVKQVQATKLKSTYTKSAQSSVFTDSVTPPPRPSASPKSSSVNSLSSESSYSDFKTPEERAAYIKEQAQKRMNERLEKLGLDRRSNRRDRSSSKVNSPEPSNAIVSSSSSVNVFEESSTSNQQFNPPAVEKIPVSTEMNDQDEESDEEEKALMRKLAAIKEKKKAKEERMAKLQREIEEAEKEETQQNQSQSNAISQKTSAPQPERSVQNAVDEDDDGWGDNEVSNTAPVAPVMTNSVVSEHHKSNPFSKNIPSVNQAQNAPPLATTSQASIPRENQPFFKQANPSNVSISSGFDSKAAEAQRRVQRGLDNDGDSDGWSDEDDVKPSPVVSATSAPKPTTPVAPPLPVLNTQYPGISSTDSVPVAPPLPVVSPVPIAPALPQISKPATPLAPPLPQIIPESSHKIAATGTIPTGYVNTHVSTSEPPIPVAPAISQGAQPPSLSNKTLDAEIDEDVDLSIPESISSDDDADNLQSYMPPPPPLP